MNGWGEDDAAPGGAVPWRGCQACRLTACVKSVPCLCLSYPACWRLATVYFTYSSIMSSHLLGDHKLAPRGHWTAPYTNASPFFFDKNVKGPCYGSGILFIEMINRWRWIYTQLPQNQHKVRDLKHNSLYFVFSASRLWYKAYIYFLNLG